MLSNKMTVSLMSLITLLALGFVASPALAADDFAATFSVDSPVYATDIRVLLKFDEAVNFTATQQATLVVTIEDENGVRTDVATVPTISASDINPARTGTQVDNQTFEFNIPASETAATDSKIHLYLPAGVTRLAPNADKTSEAASLTVNLRGALAANPDRPKVVSIQRLRPGSQTVVAAFQEAEVTGAFDVRIVITEKPHDFKIDHIAVANGTASDLVVGQPFARVANANGDADSTIRPHPIEGMYSHSGEAADGLAGVPQGTGGLTDNVPMPSGTDDMYHQYKVTITPHRRATTVAVSVKTFHDNASPYNNYYQPGQARDVNGREKLTLDVNIPKHDLEAGYRIYLPHEEGPDFPADGHYILARSKEGSFINYSNHEGSDTPDRENMAKEQTLAQLKYNVRETTAGTPEDRARTANEPQTELPNLEAFLANDGTIHLVSYVRDGDNPKYTMHDLYISEVMWGTDASQDPVSNSNWIEIRRNGGKIDVGAQDWALWFYEAHETPPTAYPANSSYEGAIGQPGEIIDIIGTKASDTGLSWSIAGKGQNGRSNIDIARTDAQVLTPTTPLISMYRMMDATDATKPADGTMASSWMQTSGPSVNLKPGREDAIIATPGAAPFETPDIAAAEKKAAEDKAAAEAAAAKKVASTGTIPSAGSIYISEIMFAGGGTLPQWIEISNGSRTEDVNLSGWTITVNNAAADADVSIGASATFTIPDETMIYMSGQDDTPSTVLVVTEKGRTSMTGLKASGQLIILDEAGSSTEVDLINAGVLTGKYTLLSDMAFEIILAPPIPEKTNVAALAATATATEKANAKAADAKAAKERANATDTVGNLGADNTAAWALPMNEEGGRSSIIRRHVQVTRGPAEPEDGTMMENWILASDTSFAQVTHIRASSYYGAANDVGTPGFRPGGALPVELSHFRPVRNKETGQVVITWSTQSELNNAGFFIKRSQQKDGEFQGH